MGWLGEKRSSRQFRAAWKSAWKSSEVVHALDYFVWPMYDDNTFAPVGPRLFGEDERHYNAIINAHFFAADVRSGRLASDAEQADRSPRAVGYVPHYFPDTYDGLPALALTREYAIQKDYILLSHVQRYNDALEAVARTGVALSGHIGNPGYLVRPTGYVDYYHSLMERVPYMTSATDARERACIESKRAAVVPIGTAVEDESEWFVCSPVFVEEIIPEFLASIA